MEPNRLTQQHQRLDNPVRMAMARRTLVYPVLLQLDRSALSVKDDLCAPPARYRPSRRLIPSHVITLVRGHHA